MSYPLFSIAGILKDQSCFLVCAGPSLNQLDLDRLNQRGILTMGVNNVACTTIRPHLWTAGDTPSRFCDNIYKDPAIIKFVPNNNLQKKLVEDVQEGRIEADLRVVDCPNIYHFDLVAGLQMSGWLTENVITWGNGDIPGDDGIRGVRSTMFIALKVLWVLGVRKVYLIGCDFKMEVGKANYAFPQDRPPSTVQANNTMYSVLNARFEMMKPMFDEAGFQIYNCTPNSGLDVFPKISYEEGIDRCLANMPTNPSTWGRYDGFHPKRTAERRTVKIPLPGPRQPRPPRTPNRTIQTTNRVPNGFVKAKTHAARL